jgi:polysaccharide pyruvyl transferase WcaK-like protein
MTTHPPTIAVWGHYHGSNLGDEMVVATIAEAIRRRVPEAEIVGICMLPEAARRMHGIDSLPLTPAPPSRAKRPRDISAGREAVPSAQRPRSSLRARARGVPGARASLRALHETRRWLREVPFAWRSWRALRDVDLVVVAGSGQLLDEWRGPWDHPYTVFRWAWLARLRRVPMAYPSIGAGPIDARLSAAMIRSAVGMAAYVSVRDGASRDVLGEIGVRRELPIVPDMGYGYRPLAGRPPQARALTEERVRSVGLNVMAHQDPRYWPRGDAARYAAYVAKIAALARALLQRGDEVTLFSSQARGDGPPTQDVLAELAQTGDDRHPDLRSALRAEDSVDALVDLIDGFDAVVAGRFHAVLIPVALGIPVVGLSYNAKTTELLSAVGLADCGLDIDAFSVEEALEALDRSCRRPDDERAAVAAGVERSRLAVEAQFDLLFGPVRDELEPQPA